MKTYLTFLSLLFALAQAAAAPTESTVESEARVWLQGFLMGYLEGREPPSRIFCPVGNEAGLRKELAHFRQPKPVGASIGIMESIEVVEIGQVQRAQVTLNYRTRSQPASITVRKVGNLFCLRDALTEDRAREIFRETMRSIQEQKKDEIFNKK
jgi:hypothetical protein